MPTERAHWVIIATKGALSVGELSTAGDGLTLLQVPLPGPLPVPQKPLLSICVSLG